MNERRKYGRVPTDGKVTVKLSEIMDKSHVEEVSTIDISPAGISFICEKDIPHGAPIKLILNFPGIYVEKDIPVIAKIVHSQKADSKFKVGCCYLAREKRSSK